MQRKLLIGLGLGTLLFCAAFFFMPGGKQDRREFSQAEAFAKNCAAAAHMSRISSLIERGELTLALEESLQVDGECKNQEESAQVHAGAITRILNAKRIAELYRALSLFQEEVDAWQNLETLLAFYPEEAMLVENGLKEEGLDLRSYLAVSKTEALTRL